MISKHSCEQSGGGEGVEVVKNEPDIHPQHGLGQLTEKRIYLNRYRETPLWCRTNDVHAKKKNATLALSSS